MSAFALRSVLELLPNAFHRIGTAGDILHAPLGLGSGMRGLLMSLERAGPTSVSKLAAMRPVSRQFVQRLVDDLLAGEWVEAILNPQHKRSPLIRLTAKGSGAIAAMQAAEVPYLVALCEGLDPDDLAAAARVLSAIAERISPDVLDQLSDGVDPVRALESSNG